MARSATAEERRHFVFAKKVSKTGTLEVPLRIVSPPLADGTVGVAYSQKLVSIGGKRPYTYALVVGALPTGLTLNANGTIAGTPTVAVIANFSVRVTDASTPTTKKSTRGYSIKIV